MFNNNSPAKFLGLVILSCVSCVSCDSKTTSTDANPTQTQSTQAQLTQAQTTEIQSIRATRFTRMPAAACSNLAPSGELLATRVDAANISGDNTGLYEGPVWLDDALYFSHFQFTDGFPSRILKLDQNGQLTTFLEDSGSNGLAVDANANLILASHKNKALVAYNSATKEHKVLVKEYQNNAFNSPNDMAITSDGVIYFTDPNYQQKAAPGGQDKTRVYRVSAAGEVSVVDESFSNPNGIALSPDEKYLYVVGNQGQGVLRKYEIQNGIPQTGVDIASDINVPDGMAVDCAGNIYVTEHLGRQVKVFSPEGQQIAIIKVDANITNAAFGGPEGKTLYLTGAGAVWTVDLTITGSAY
jgi:gluconolactonase